MEDAMGYRLYGQVSPRMQVLTAIIAIGLPVVVALAIVCLISEGIQVPRWIIGIACIAVFIVLLFGTSIARRNVKKDLD
jgi:chromate transport protein ChrA